MNEKVSSVEMENFMQGRVWKVKIMELFQLEEFFLFLWLSKEKKR